jgi:hypothetical protein
MMEMLFALVSPMTFNISTALRTLAALEARPLGSAKLASRAASMCG